MSVKNIYCDLICVLNIFNLQPAGALASETTTVARPSQSRSSPAGPQGIPKSRGKKGKGGKAKAEAQQEIDPRKLELLNWVMANQIK